MLIAMAKLGTPEMLGQFSLGLAVTSPVFLLASLQLRTAEATDARQEYALGHYLGLQYVMNGAGLATVLAVCILAGYRREVVQLTLLLGAAKAIETVSEVLYGRLQQMDRLEWVGKALLVKGPLALALMAGAVALTGSVAWGTAGILAGWAVVVLTLEGEYVRRFTGAGNWMAVFRPRFEPSALKSLAWVAAPLSIAALFTSLIVNTPRYFLEHHRGERELGIFAAMAFVPLGLHTVSRSVAQLGAASLAREFARGETRSFYRILGKSLAALSALGLGGILLALVAAKPFLSAVYHADYAEYGDVFLWLMIGGAVSIFAYGAQVGSTAARRFAVQVPLTALGVAITALGCALLVPAYGMKGAAIAFAAGYGVQACGFAIVLVRAASGCIPHSIDPPSLIE